MRTIDIETITLDLVSISPIVVVTGTSDGPDDALGNEDGNTTGDIDIVSPEDIQLTAERHGTGDGRAYTLTFPATDGAGNSSSAATTVEVLRG